ncbi:MAG: thiamine pyrophosphate-dependent enzyme [Tuberibacillus sp.]
MKERLSAANAIVRCMELEGVTQAFCVPGESYLPIMDALYEHPSIKLIATRHESGAAFMAEGYAKAAGKPAVVMATRGVGAANLSIGVHTAYQDSTPMVVFLGQVDSRFRGREGFQEVDLDRFFEPISKWAVEIHDPNRIPEIVQRAFRMAVSGRPGPVVVAFPEDVLAQEVEAQFAEPMKTSKPVPDEHGIENAIELLENARRPFILAGGGIKWSNAEELLVNFSESFSLPVVSSFRRHDVFPNQHPHYVGHLGLGTAKEILETAKSADVVLVLGSRLSEVTTQDYSLFSENQKIIHIDIEPSVIGKVYPPAIGIVSDCGMAIKELHKHAVIRLSPEKYKDWVKERREAYVRTSTLEDVEYADHPNGCNLKGIMKALKEALPEDAVITNDAGNFAGWLHAFYPFTKEKTYIGPTSGAMGYGLPAAIGAKAALPHTVVVSLSGDGGFMMTMQELETAKRHNIPVISIVFNNSMYGTIRMHQEKHFPERVIATDLGPVDFKALANAMNIESYYVDASGDFKEVLHSILDRPMDRPILIEVKMDPDFISTHSTIESIRKNALKR